MLNRRAWKAYEEVCDQRALTNRELISAGSIFSRVEIKEVGYAHHAPNPAFRR
jgi:hypothetical protein